MTDSNPADSDSNDSSYISSELTEIRGNCEKKINDLQAQFSQLKDLMMAILNKPNEDSPPGSSQGSSKQPCSRHDILQSCSYNSIEIVDSYSTP